MGWRWLVVIWKWRAVCRSDWQYTIHYRQVSCLVCICCLLLLMLFLHVETSNSHKLYQLVWYV